MRVFAILVASLVAFGGLAGCMGAKKETPEETVDKTNSNGTTPTPGTGTTPQIQVRNPLVATLTLDAPAWIQSGTDVPASLSAPAGAKAPLSYTWAIGPLPGTKDVVAAKADTGSAKSADYIAGGASKTVTFTTPGVYLMHCHPHPFMMSNVTVIDGYAGLKAVEVFITDGATPKESRYVPENIVVGPGTVVTYKNVGAQPHTATAMGAQSPPLKLLPLKADKGNVKVDGEGWQRVVAIVTDAEGRIGITEQPIYATATLPAFETKTEEVTFQAAAPAPLAGTPAEAAAPAPYLIPVQLEQGGLVTINYTFSDAAGATPAGTLAEVEVHFTKDGETQDTLTGGPDATNSLVGKAQAGAYTIRVVPIQGVEIVGTVVIEIVYELVPPPPTSAAPPADGHGGHAH